MVDKLPRRCRYRYRKGGKAKITVKTADGAKTAECAVTVVSPAKWVVAGNYGRLEVSADGETWVQTDGGFGSGSGSSSSPIHVNGVAYGYAETRREKLTALLAVKQ